ncbi:ATP-binding protein [uncultured Treponema sp.]|uniref:ATP-binding protein n=1 Tax=uncultured Treponema sp. TaxID=162155 RepID=UPI002616D193|nr:ATP-binding protein [uncultured Treponema sp.]
MLVEIQSDVFKGKYIQDGKITFHKGLNTIVANESTNNSTGKSSFLLAIDFAFGGNTYVTGGGKIIENIGHHAINFTFEFKGEKVYYSRSTEDLNNVSICDSGYSVIDTISLKEFQKKLAESYGFEDESLTFRGAVSPYFRISHKSSKNLEEFLKGNSMENARDCVVNFEKLFDRYKEIAAEKNNADDAAKAKETFNDAVKRNFILSSIKTDSDLAAVYEDINRLKEELSELSRTNDKEILAFDSNNAEKQDCCRRAFY